MSRLIDRRDFHPITHDDSIVAYDRNHDLATNFADVFANIACTIKIIVVFKNKRKTKLLENELFTRAEGVFEKTRELNSHQKVVHARRKISLGRAIQIAGKLKTDIFEH